MTDLARERPLSPEDAVDLGDIVRRRTPARPWDEGRNIPWDEPGFSERMLTEHLSQDHDMASRRADVIDRHVAWIHEALLDECPSRILDVCCGPGLYAVRLAELGHSCRGVDYSPASIEHAVGLAEQRGVDATFVLGDVRDADLGEGHDLAMLIFGEFNVFMREEAAAILARVHDALSPGGMLLLEPQTFECVMESGESPPTWYASDGGLFSDRPHVCLKESFWDADTKTTTTRFYIIGEDGGVEEHAMTAQAYDEADFASLLSEAGFRGGDFMRRLAGVDIEGQAGLSAIVARRD